MKFIHAADLHLDSPLRNLERYDGAPLEIIRRATRSAMENLVELAINEQVSLVILAGDIYDGNWRDYNTGLFFHHQLAKLREANIQVVWIVGNHDAASEITKTIRAVQQLPNVHRLPEHHPNTIILTCADLEIAVHGQGFANKAVTTNLTTRYPQSIPGHFNIGILHTSLSGRPGHEPYAPCTLTDLIHKNYDYWALGHVHKQEILHQAPWIAFSGNIQGRDIGETGAKGCLLITVEAGKVQQVEAKPLDVLRWRHCIIDVTGAADEEAVLETIIAHLQQQQKTADRPEAIRLEITGICQAYTALNHQLEQWTTELRAQATNISNGSIWLEKIKLNMYDNIALKHLETQEDGPGLLLHALRNLTLNDPAIERLKKDLAHLKTSLPIELRDDPWLKLDEQDTFATLRDDVTQLLLPHLISATSQPTL